MRGVQKMGCGSALVNSRLTPELFRLRKEHQHARSPVGHQLILLLLRAMRNGKPIAMLVANRLAIHQQHVVMRATALKVMQRDMPGIQHPVTGQRHLLPVRESTGDLNRGRRQRLALGRTPAENLAVSLPGRRRFLCRSNPAGWSRRSFGNDGAVLLWRFLQKSIAKILRHMVWLFSGKLHQLHARLKLRASFEGLKLFRVWIRAEDFDEVAVLAQKLDGFDDLAVLHVAVAINEEEIFPRLPFAGT